MSYTSRAGEKLQSAIDNFGIQIKGKIAADFGSSTGGFVDVLLKNGALRVYSVDTSYGELAWKLRQDPRVVVMERTNAMHVTLPEKVEVISIDVGWTKQVKILPSAFGNLKKGGIIISLIKPHYEADSKFLRNGKLLEEKQEEIVKKVLGDIAKLGGKVLKLIESPITGKRSQNKEFLALIIN